MEEKNEINILEYIVKNSKNCSLEENRKHEEMIKNISIHKKKVFNIN